MSTVAVSCMCTWNCPIPTGGSWRLASGAWPRRSSHELLVATDEIKRLIQAKARVPEMVASAKSDGMTTLVQDGILKSLQGLTDFRQVKAVAIK